MVITEPFATMAFSYFVPEDVLNYVAWVLVVQVDCQTGLFVIMLHSLALLLSPASQAQLTSSHNNTCEVSTPSSDVPGHNTTPSYTQSTSWPC